MLLKKDAANINEAATKIIAQRSWAYTLYEQDDGSYLVKVAIPAKDAAWATYEKEYRLNTYEKLLVKFFPGTAQKIADRELQREKALQSKGEGRDH